MTNRKFSDERREEVAWLSAVFSQGRMRYAETRLDQSDTYGQ